jgi:hypothetical protein
VSLAALMADRGLDPGELTAVRVCLHAQDRCDVFRSTADLAAAGLVPLYVRMQEGRRLGTGERPTLIFVAEPAGHARLVAFSRFRPRRRGVAPGDIVYDYDGAPLLHAFIARARCPTFYDAFDEPGLEDLAGRLVVHWPRPLMRSIRRADDPGLEVATSFGGRAAEPSPAHHPSNGRPV